MEVCGRVVDFDESLEFSFDSPDCTWEETQNLPEQWGIEKFYRIRLKTAMKAGEKHNYTEGEDLVKWVLGRPAGEEKPMMEKAFALAAECAEEWIENGIDAAMRLTGTKK